MNITHTHTSTNTSHYLLIQVHIHQITHPCNHSETTLLTHTSTLAFNRALKSVVVAPTASIVKDFASCSVCVVEPGYYGVSRQSLT